METPLLSSPGEDSARKMSLACHFPASEKSVIALIKHHEVCGTIAVTQPKFIPQEMYRLCIYNLKDKMIA